MRRNLPDPNLFLGKKIPGREDVEIQSLLGSGCNGLVFKAYSDVLKVYFACKVIPSSNLAQPEGHESRWQLEFQRANALNSGYVVDVVDVKYWRSDDGIDCAVLFSKLVNGSSVKDYVKQNPGNLSILFIETFVTRMLDFVAELQVAGFNHGDLHLGNILVEERSNALGRDPFSFRVTDFGVSPFVSQSIARDDFMDLANNLRILLKNVRLSELSPRDRYAFDVLNNHVLGVYLTDNDPTRNLCWRNPAEIYRRFQREVASLQQSGFEARLSTPFDFLSCEQIGDSHELLRTLYSELYLDLPDLLSANNHVLTGPRGCGKSTVFKSMSLSHRMKIDEADPEQLRFLGIYYRCDDLYFSFPRFNAYKREQAVDIPIHYLTATLLAEVLQDLDEWSKRFFRAEFVEPETQVSKELWNLLGLNPPSEPNANTFRRLASALQRERGRAMNHHRFSHDEKRDLPTFIGPDVLAKACQAITQGLQFLGNRPFFFFVDDYSSPKITKDLQLNLNRLLMQRQPHSFFKVATESPVSYEKSDLDGKIYVEGREYKLINLGVSFLRADQEKKVEFIEDIFARRLKAIPNYPVESLGRLLGENKARNENAIALQIRNDEQVNYWGSSVLCSLCSGDIHLLIGMVGDMVSAAGGPEGLRGLGGEPIPVQTQSTIIKHAAGTFLSNVNSIPRHGERLLRIVTAFGNVAGSYIRHRDTKNEGREVPHQASRIEPLEVLDLSPQAREVYNELLRYSVFIEDTRGRSQRGVMVPRLYLRRFLIPSFKLTFSLHDSLRVKNRELELLLLKPDEFERARRLKHFTAQKTGELFEGQDLSGGAL